jgi:hypothetical protein
MSEQARDDDESARGYLDDLLNGILQKPLARIDQQAEQIERLRLEATSLQVKVIGTHTRVEDVREAVKASDLRQQQRLEAVVNTLDVLCTQGHALKDAVSSLVSTAQAQFELSHSESRTLKIGQADTRAAICTLESDLNDALQRQQQQSIDMAATARDLHKALRRNRRLILANLLLVHCVVIGVLASVIVR